MFAAAIRVLCACTLVTCGACARPSNDVRASATSARLSAPSAPSAPNSADAPPRVAAFSREGSSSTLALGRAHSCAIFARGEVWCWGGNDFGQLGVGRLSAQENRAAPVPKSSRVVEIAAGRDFTCAREVDGTVSCWGALPGRGVNASPAPSPVRVLGGARRLFAAESRVCVLSGTRDISCWGDASYGDIGDGSNSDRPTPVAVATGLPEIAGLSLSYGGGCAWSTNGRGECWGRQYASKPDALRVPFELPGLKQLVLGTQHDCALFESGHVSCSVDAPPPRPHPSRAPQPSLQLAELSQVSELTAGGGSACAIVPLGAAVCWSFHAPSAISASGGLRLEQYLPSITAKFGEVAIGAGHWCARRDDGRIECWGDNERGQLGDGTAFSRPTPSPVLMPGEATPAPPAPKPETDACATWSDCTLLSGGSRCIAVGPTTGLSQPSYATSDAYCACSANHCERRAVAEVTCTQDSDCWFTEGFPRRPAARRKGGPGGQGPFRPCVDGDRAPVCFEKRCSFGKVYGC